LQWIEKAISWNFTETKGLWLQDPPGFSVIIKFRNGEKFVNLKSFSGKVLVEKLLRVCDVGTIYLLIRPKKGVQPEVRLEEYVNHIVSVLLIQSINHR
jgi:hypothetical protein